MPELTKAELIDGVVYMPPPVSDEFHAGPQFDLISWLGLYRMGTPGVVGGGNGTLRLDMKNRPQPDAYLRILPEHGGKATTDNGGYVTSAPELLAEVAASTASLDLNAKFELYRRNRALEYLVWRVYEDDVDWFVLRGDQYEPLKPAEDEIYRSIVFPGLWLDARALVRGDMQAVAQAVQRGLASPEHGSFVAGLAETAARSKTP